MLSKHDPCKCFLLDHLYASDLVKIRQLTLLKFDEVTGWWLLHDRKQTGLSGQFLLAAKVIIEIVEIRWL